MSTLPAGSSHRSAGIDAARGLAVLLMIQTHAYDGWLRHAERTDLPFRLTRLLGTLPLPMFLGLAGLSAGLRVRAAATRGLAANALRFSLLRNGLQVLAWGYALNALYAVLDGAHGLATLLRVDVLHAIGLSLSVLALCVGEKPDSTAIDVPAFVRRSLLVSALALLCSPWLTHFGHALSGTARFAWAPLLEVPGLSSMPLVPLLWFCGVFAALGARCPVETAPREVHTRLSLGSALLCALGLLAAHGFTRLGIPIQRTEVSIWANALDLSGRAGLVIFGTCALARIPGVYTSSLHTLGQHSLFVYGLHLPFCYGRFARPLKHALAFPSATLYLGLLAAGCALAVQLRTALPWSSTEAPRRGLSLKP